MNFHPTISIKSVHGGYVVQAHTCQLNEHGEDWEDRVHVFVNLDQMLLFVRQVLVDYESDLELQEEATNIMDQNTKSINRAKRKEDENE